MRPEIVFILFFAAAAGFISGAAVVSFTQNPPKVELKQLPDTEATRNLVSLCDHVCPVGSYSGSGVRAKDQL
jgi:hypothetical protein